MNKLYEKLYKVDKLSLTGRRDTHVSYISKLRTFLSPVVSKNLISLSDAAVKDGINIAVYSGFRSFDHQLNIWNNKLSGKKVILDDKGLPIKHDAYSLHEKIELMLKWMSIPSMSRHHWGTDVDIYDSSVPMEENFTLLPRDYDENQKFYKVYDWMKLNAYKYGFYMVPTAHTLLNPEPWHWTYKSIADQFESQMTRAVVIECIENCKILGKDFLLDNIDRFFVDK